MKNDFLFTPGPHMAKARIVTTALGSLTLSYQTDVREVTESSASAAHLKL